MLRLLQIPPPVTQLFIYYSILISTRIIHTLIRCNRELPKRNHLMVASRSFLKQRVCLKFWELIRFYSAVVSRCVSQQLVLCRVDMFCLQTSLELKSDTNSLFSFVMAKSTGNVTADLWIDPAGSVRYSRADCIVQGRKRTAAFPYFWEKSKQLGVGRVSSQYSQLLAGNQLWASLLQCSQNKLHSCICNQTPPHHHLCVIDWHYICYCFTTELCGAGESGGISQTSSNGEFNSVASAAHQDFVTGGDVTVRKKAEEQWPPVCAPH